MGLSLIAAPAAGLAPSAGPLSPTGSEGTAAPNGLAGSGAPSPRLFVEAFASLLSISPDVPAAGLTPEEAVEGAVSDEPDADTEDNASGFLPWISVAPSLPEPPAWIAPTITVGAVFTRSLPSTEETGGEAAVPIDGTGSGRQDGEAAIDTLAGLISIDPSSPLEAEAGVEAPPAQEEIKPVVESSPAAAAALVDLPAPWIPAPIEEQSAGTAKQDGASARSPRLEPRSPVEAAVREVPTAAARPVVMTGTVVETQVEPPAAIKGKAAEAPGPGSSSAPVIEVSPGAGNGGPSSGGSFDPPASTPESKAATPVHPDAPAVTPGDTESSTREPKIESAAPKLGQGSGFASQTSTPVTAFIETVAAPTSPRPSSSSADAPAVEAPLEVKPLPRFNPSPKVAVRIDPPAEASDSGSASIERVRPVEVVFEQRGTALNFSVQTDDPQLAAELRRSIGDLASRLEREGFEARLRPSDDGVSRSFSIDSMAGESTRRDSEGDGRNPFSRQSSDERPGSGSGRRQGGQGEHPQGSPSRKIPDFAQNFTQSMQTTFEENR